MMDMWITYPSVGYETFPTAANTTNGRYPAFYRDDGYPAGYPTPPDIRADIANGTWPLAVSKEGLDLPRYQNWSLTWQRQITPNLLLDISYVANHGTRLIIARSAAGYPMRNDNNPDVLKYGAALLGTQITADSVQALSAVAAMPVDSADGLHKPYAGFAGTLAQALRPFPQYQSINWRNWNDGVSMYHSLQTKLERRFSNGLQMRLAYVYSRFYNDGSESGVSANTNAGSGSVQNPMDVHAGEWSRSFEDVPHTVIASYTYQLPFGRGRTYGANVSGVVDKFIGGWGL